MGPGGQIVANGRLNGSGSPRARSNGRGRDRRHHVLGLGRDGLRDGRRDVDRDRADALDDGGTESGETLRVHRQRDIDSSHLRSRRTSAGDGPATTGHLSPTRSPHLGRAGGSLLGRGGHGVIGRRDRLGLSDVTSSVQREPDADGLDFRVRHDRLAAIYTDSPLRVSALKSMTSSAVGNRSPSVPMLFAFTQSSRKAR